MTMNVVTATPISGGSYKWLVLFNVMLTTFMAVLDSTVVNTGLPVIMGTLGASMNSAEWILTGYMLSMATILPAAGWLPPVVEGLQDDPVGGRACRPGLPRRTAREHHASDGRACAVRTKTEMSRCRMHRLISVFL